MKLQYSFRSIVCGRMWRSLLRVAGREPQPSPAFLKISKILQIFVTVLEYHAQGLYVAGRRGTMKGPYTLTP